ncbi:MAG: MGH1-like glycoside hydrolase domain-containing protein [Solirubrobacteraceae bacterium]
MSALLPDRAWGTWDERFPACMIHIPSRFAVRVTVFSTTAGRYEELAYDASEAFRLGEHTSDSGYVSLEAHVHGSRLLIEFAKGEWSGVSGRVRILEPGEMLFRLAIIVEAGFLAPARPDPREQPRQMVDGGTRELSLGHRQAGEHRTPVTGLGRWRSQWFAVAVSETPAVAAAYPNSAALAGDLQNRGWLYRPQGQAAGDLLAFRFYGDPHQPIRFAVAQDADPQPAAAAAAARLDAVDELIETARREAVKPPAPVRAVRDVMAWNTIWDQANSRPYTTASRAWVAGFGGWGVWMSDTYYNAMMCAQAGDTIMARANLQTVLAAQQAAGNVPSLAAADDEWVDRSQLPVACYAVWRTYLQTGDRTLLAELYPALCRQLEWVRANRDGNGNGLFEYGSSPVGRAQGVLTKQGALNEPGMDNLAVFDEARFNPATGALEFEEPGHNSLLALEWELLARVAAALGRDTEAEAHLRRSRGLAQLISETLWDPQRQVFAGRHWDGAFAAHISPTSFFPLVAGAATPEQAQALVNGHLLDEAAFWGPLPLPSAPFNDPVSAENSYWRGRIWAPMLLFVWEGLQRAGFPQVARDLTERAWAMFERDWQARRHCHENYSSLDPDGHEAHDSDPFYSWGALIAFMRVCEQDNLSLWG